MARKAKPAPTWSAFWAGLEAEATPHVTRELRRRGWVLKDRVMGQPWAAHRAVPLFTGSGWRNGDVTATDPDSLIRRVEEWEADALRNPDRLECET